MAPLQVRKKINDANIGFYFHSPFPASAIFNTFSKREEVLKSILCSDLLGFHLYEYARNFCNSCQRILKLNYEFSRGGSLGINYQGKVVQLRVAHTGIDVDFIREILKSKEYKEHKESFNKHFKSIFNEIRSQGSQNRFQNTNTKPPTIIASIDTFHHMSGLNNKLKA